MFCNIHLFDFQNPIEGVSLCATDDEALKALCEGKISIALVKVGDPATLKHDLTLAAHRNGCTINDWFTNKAPMLERAHFHIDHPDDVVSVIYRPEGGTCFPYPADSQLICSREHPAIEQGEHNLTDRILTEKMLASGRIAAFYVPAGYKVLFNALTTLHSGPFKTLADGLKGQPFDSGIPALTSNHLQIGVIGYPRNATLAPPATHAKLGL
jgi:hypothetical protein